MNARAESEPSMSHSTSTLLTNSLYETDFVRWTDDQVRLLREGRLAELDLSNLIEEMEDVGNSQRDAIESRLAVLVAHLLKWKYQPGARSNSWKATITEQRERIARIVKRSPSLRSYPDDVFVACFRSARLAASQETGMDFTLFPDACPFTLDQALDPTFLPKQPDLHDQIP